ncbi:MAG: protein kinase [Deltaproteobacteria bacterium]|nr:protein kinase [Deltaproteobacteria bacterium]
MTPPAERPSVAVTTNAKAIENTRNFLSSLFMGIRTAHIHDPSNKAFEASIRNVRDAADALFGTTGGFSIQFVEDSAFLNGQRIKFASGAYESMRELRRALESKELGGIEMRSAPSYEGIRKLIMLFARDVGEGTKADVGALGFNLLGVQKFSDGERAGLKIDRRVFALQCYAKLILALREQRERIEREREVDWGDGVPPAPRHRAVRVVQDMVELTEDRADFLMKLSASSVGASPAELHGVNSCVIALALGHAFGLERQDLVEIGIAALFHDAARIGSMMPGPAAQPGVFSGKIFSVDRASADSSFVRMLSQTGIAEATRLRSIIVAERRVCAGDEFPWGKPRPAPHIFSRIAGCAIAYSGLTTGVLADDGARRRPLDALAILMNDPPRVDPRVVDLLVNMLRAYPVGAEVVLDDGRRGVVRAHRPSGRWDRPVIMLEGGESIDLMAQDGGRFDRRIEATVRYLGLEPKLEGLFRDEAVEAPAEALDLPKPSPPELEELDDELELVLGLPDDAIQPSPEADGDFSDRTPPSAFAQEPETPEVEQPATHEDPGLPSDDRNEPDDSEAGLELDSDPPRGQVQEPSAKRPSSKEPFDDDATEDATEEREAFDRAPTQLRPAERDETVLSPRTPKPRRDTELNEDPDIARLDFGGDTPPEGSRVPPELLSPDPATSEAPATESPKPRLSEPVRPLERTRPQLRSEPPRARPRVRARREAPGDAVAAHELIDRYGYAVEPESRKAGAAVEYRGADPDDGTLVIVRVLDRDVIDDSILSPDAQMELFERECVVAAKLAHPALPRVVEVGQRGSERFVVYERSDDPTLEALVSSGTFNGASKARRVVRSLAEALAHLHQRGVVLCDLRPAKVQVAPDGTARIWDVGMAMSIGEQPHPLLHSLPTLLAPEFLYGAAFGERSDQFSLGCLAYQLATGQPPWPGNWAVADPSHPAPAPLDESALFPDAIARMLDRDPSRRYESCDTVARYLTRVQALVRRRRAG